MSEGAADAVPGDGRNREYGIAPSGRSLPASARLGPVRLQVADLERSREFYEGILGLLPLEVGGAEGAGAAAGDQGSAIRRTEGGDRGRSTAEAGLALGANGRGTTLVELVERPGASPVPRRGRLGLYHYALRVPDRPSLGRLAIHLREQGVAMGTADHRVSEALYLRDPDGLGIEVYRDRPRERWESKGRQLVITTEPLGLEELMDAGRGEEAFGGLPSGTVMGHVHLHVGDLESAARFYHEGLGFEKTAWDYPGALFLGAGGYHHHVGLNTWARGAGRAGAGDARLLSWTLVLPGESTVEDMLSQAAEVGFGVQDGRDGRAEARAVGARLEDPWGTAVEFVTETGGAVRGAL